MPPPSCAAATGPPGLGLGLARPAAPLPNPPPPAWPLGLPRAARAPAPPVAAGALALPLDLLTAIAGHVVSDDAREGRPSVLQFTSRAWLAACRAAAYARVSVDVPAALYYLSAWHQQRREQVPEQASCLSCAAAPAAAAALVGAGADSKAAQDSLLSWLAVRLPHARELEMRGVEAAPPALASRLCALLLAQQAAGTLRMRSLATAWLPCLPALLPCLALESLSLAAPTAVLLQHLPLLRQQPLRHFALSDAAESCAAPIFTAVDASCSAPACCNVVAAVSSLPSLRTLSLLGGTAGSDAAALVPPPEHAAGAASSPRAASAAAAGAGVKAPLLSLQLVAAAAGLPLLQHLELSLAFCAEPVAAVAQQQYLLLLGGVLRQQHLQRQVAAARGAGGTAGADGGCKVALTVHEHVVGDLSAVPMASCTLLLNWDSDHSSFHQELELCGVCFIPTYFALALLQMTQLTSLTFTGCERSALDCVPWARVLRGLPHLASFQLQQHAGAELHGLWEGLGACAGLTRLQITGSHYASWGGGAAPPTPQLALPGTGPSPPGGSEGNAAPALTLAALRQLDLSSNALRASDLPAWVVALSSLTMLILDHNRLEELPASVAALPALRHLSLAGNQVECLAPGRYCQTLEVLRLQGNPSLRRLPLHALLRVGRLRRLGLPRRRRAGDAGGCCAGCPACMQRVVGTAASAGGGVLVLQGRLLQEELPWLVIYEQAGP
eukprot:scaffold5.g636.t1